MRARAGVVAALLSALAAMPGAGQAEVLGRVEARLDDIEYRWNTITVTRGEATSATANLRLGQRLTEVQIEGHPGEDFTSRDVFSLDLRYIGAYAPGAGPLGFDILYMPDGLGGPFWTSNGAGVAPVIRVLSFEVWGAVGQIDALFAGELCLRPMISAATDPDTCRTLTGRVETELFVDRGRARSGAGPTREAAPPGTGDDAAR